jgi:large subunit ribosomal protein L29
MMRAAEELVQLDAEELNDRLRAARRELYELRFKAAVGQLDNNRAIRKTRKDIARILTVLHLRVLEPQTAPVGVPSVAADHEVVAEERAVVDPEAAVAEAEPEPEPEPEPEAVAKPVRRTRRTKDAGEEGTAS